MKVMRDAAKLAQWRAPEPDKGAIKAARLNRRVESVASIIRRYVSEADMRKLRKRGCLHSVDFPEKRNRSLRTGEDR